MKTKLKDGQKLPTQFRSVHIELAGTHERGLALLDEASRILSNVSICSDTPYERFFGTEILSHKPGAQRMERLKTGAAPLLFNHDRDIQLGKPLNARVEDGRTYADFKFSERKEAQERMNDAKDGILTEVSIGYIVHKFEVDEKTDTYTATDWEILEVSLVTIPADATVGVGRAFEEESSEIVLETKKDIDQPRENSLDGLRVNPDTRSTTQVTCNKNMPETTLTAPVQLTEAQQNERIDNAISAELGRQEEIRKTAERFADRGVSKEDANAFLTDKRKTAAEFKCWILENRLNAVQVDLKRDSLAAGVPEHDIRKFSLVKAMHELGSHGGVTGLEKEICDHAAKQAKRSINGIIVPTEVLALHRDLSVGTPTAGGNLVATELRNESFVNILRGRLIVEKMGARVIDGLVGNVAIPRQTAGATAYWVSETGATTESNLAFDQIAMTPKGVSAIQDLSKLLTIQSSVGIENMVRSDIAKVLALAIDSAALTGTGASNQPTGITSTSGIGSVAIGTNGGTITWPAVVGLETSVATSNADFGTLGYVTNPKVRGQAKVTPKQSAGVEGNFIWPDMPFPGDPSMGMLNGYKAGVSTQLPSNLTKGTAVGTTSALIFGNWDELIIGQWNGVDIVVDPYTQAANRVVRYVVSMWVDILVRHPASFAACLDIVTG